MSHQIYIKELGPKGKAKFMALNPTFIGAVMGYHFYECPIRGDGSTLYAINKEQGTWGRTWFYEVPTLEELM